MSFCQSSEVHPHAHLRTAGIKDLKGKLTVLQKSRAWSWLTGNVFPMLIGLVGIIAVSLYFIDCFSDFYSAAECITKDAVNRLVGEDFRFFSFPHLAWHTDKLLYPCGIDLTYMAWLFELNFVEWLSVTCLGFYFPCQWYFVYSLCVVYFGSYALIKARKGSSIACCFASALTFCNYSVLCKFPGHLALSTVHWMVLSILFDVITIEKFWNRERFSSIFILLRLFVLLNVFGMDIGYIAGIACVSFAITIVYLFLVVLAQKSFSGFTRQLISDFIRSYWASKWSNLLLSFCLFLVAWVYLPQIYQILCHSSGVTSGGVNFPNGPLRLLLPIFPNHGAVKMGAGRFVRVDTLFAWNAGWSFLLLFIAFAARDFRRDFKKWLPGVLLLILFLVMNDIPLIKLFPAFKCSRIAERFSPYLLLVCLMPAYYSVSKVNFSDFRARLSEMRVIVLSFAALLGVELTTAYSAIKVSNNWSAVKPFPAGYKEAVSSVKRLSGDAIFFYPFGVWGGDGCGFKCGVPLERISDLVAHQMQFAAHCQKKANCVYAGRMPYEHLKRFRPLFWEMYDPHQVWMASAWTSLQEFFRHSRFAAIVVARNHVSPELFSNMQTHWGVPIDEFAISDATYCIFPVPDSWKCSCASGRPFSYPVVRVPLLQQMRVSQSSMRSSEGYVNISKGEVLYGPYIELAPGEYQVAIDAESSDGQEVSVTSDVGKRLICKAALRNGNTFVTFGLREKAGQVEIVVSNGRDLPIKVKSIELMVVDEEN